VNALRYKAFISYSHKDESWAAWLHKSLESYRVPGRLAGTTGSHGIVPSRLTPIFRDRDELSSGADLSAKIKEAMAESESLLLICSPAAAQSKWVNEEIRYFRSLGRTRIYSLIVDGDPQDPDPARACFPPALLERDGQDAVEPLAADARKWADGKALAKLKLAAGILGVRLDELRQRELQRKRKLQVVAGIAVVAVVALLLFSAQARMAEKAALQARQAQQASAEAMLAKFLEQSERLGDVADLATQKALGDALSGYLANLNPADLTLESRRQLGVALSNRGVILRAEGNLEEAMEAFRNAHQTLQLLVDDSQGDQEALFELSQAAYWIGQVHLDLGRLDQAGEWFGAYADISDSLHAMQPDNADWTMEAAYAQSNLGNLEKRKFRSDPQQVLQFYTSALLLNQQAAEQDRAYEIELTDSHADLADALLGVCELSQAMEQRLLTVELAASHFGLNPASNRLKSDYANALSGLSWVQQQTGDLEQAKGSLQHSLDLHSELVQADPSNLEKRWSLVIKSARKAQILQLSGDDSGSWDLSRAVEEDMQELVGQPGEIQITDAIDYGKFLRDFSDLAFRKNEPERADSLLGESISRLRAIVDQNPDNKKALNELVMTYFSFWGRNGATLPDEPAAAWLDSVREASNPVGCQDLNIAARLYVISGAPEQARIYVSRLIGKGYREPEFMQFCSEYGLCEMAESG